MAERTLTLLLGARRYFTDQALAPGFARALVRAERETLAEGERAQLQRQFRVRPAGAWPSAALIEGLRLGPDERQRHQWLRADPVCLQADLSTARLMAWGNLGLSFDEAESLLRPLKPLFGDAGFPIEQREPEAWLLRIPRESRLPDFPHPLDALGGDAFVQLGSGAEARRWRALLAEAQVLLHEHPVNETRRRAGRPPANSLWFWGGGSWPDQVEGPVGTVVAVDPEVLGFAHAAGCPSTAAVDATRPGLIDLRPQRQWRVVEDVCGVARAALGTGAIDALVLDFADGHRARFTHGQRWRFWRRAARDLSA